MFKEMKISRLILDPVTNMPIIILKDLEDELTLPIWIGLLEASAIALELEKEPPQRPMTHDLIKNILSSLKVRVVKVELTDLRESTFYALIYLNRDGKTFKIDARPSDAIAIALRTSAPIYVDEKVIRKFKKVNLESIKDTDNVDESAKLQDLLEEMSPEDFGKYKM
jgi:bifunctional DNase/RNase